MVDDPMLVKFLCPFRFLCIGNNEPTESPSRPKSRNEDPNEIMSLLKTQMK